MKTDRHNFLNSNINTHKRMKMKNISLIIVLLFRVNFSFGQLIMAGGLPDDLLTKQYYSWEIDTIKVHKDSVFVLVKQFENETLVFQEEQIFLPSKAIFHGRSIQWYINGQKKCEGTFQLGKQNNDWKYWDSDGNQVPKEIVSANITSRRGAVVYIDGNPVQLQPIKSNCIAKFDSILKVDVYSVADEEPEYNGGTIALLSFFNKNFCYPKDQEEFQGSIYISFIIEADGKPSNIDIYKYDGAGLSPVDKEAIRVFSCMPYWKPGQCEGKNIAMKMVFPIRF